MAFNNSTKYYFDFTGYYTVTSFNIALGVSFNLWMFAAIITSREMRGIFRNKFVCMLCFNAFVKAIVCNTVEMDMTLGYFEYGRFLTSCHYHTFMYVFRDIIDMAMSYSFLLFIIQYICQVLDYDARNMLPPRGILIGTVLVLTGPWILSGLIAPMITYHYFKKRYGIFQDGCMWATRESEQVLEVLICVVPLILGSILVFVAVILWVCRWRGVGIVQGSNGIRAELISRGTQIDNVRAYVVCALVWIVLAIPSVFDGLGIQSGFQSVKFYEIVWCLFEVRLVLLPITLLFLRDIYERVKTWRPWYRPAPGIDLTVKYQIDNDMNTGSGP